MADEDAKTEVTKEILAPAEGPREDLISTAVKFLQNPKVQKSPLQQRKLFLERKGLTKEEIDVAVQRSGVLEKVATTTQVYNSQGQQGLLVPAQPSSTSLPVVPVLNRWSGVRDILSVIALVGGLTYAAYRFYKEILSPYLFGISKEKNRLDKVEAALTKVQETLTLLQDTISKQGEKVQELKHEAFSKQSSDTLVKVQDAQYATEIKTELTSIKGLLLNRRQFPPTPSSTPLLPAWQLTNNAPSSAADSVSRGSLVTPGGDGEKFSEEAVLNENEKGEDDSETKPVTEVQYSPTSAETDSKSEDVDQNVASLGETTQTTKNTQSDDDEEVD